MESLLVTGVNNDADSEEEEPNFMVDESSDEESDDEQHASLLASMSALSDNNSKAVPERTVAYADVSEFGFNKYRKESRLNLSELVDGLNSSSSSQQIKKGIRRLKAEKVANVPLVKPQQERLTRSIAYQVNTEEISKWQPLVRQNRKAEQLTFPLQQPNLRLMTSDEITKKFQARTPLEREIAMLLHGSDHVESDTKMLTRAEEKALQAMSLEEAKERRAELMKCKALMTYNESKFRRQKQIKSKRFHKVLRKEKLKKEEKQLDELQKTDPEAYLERIEYADKARVEERMTLKHRGGSKFARRKMMYARYDPLARQAVQDMIDKNKELTKKTYVSSEDDSEGGVSMDEEEELRMLSAALDNKGDNPWMKAPARPSEFIRPKKITQDKKNAHNDESDSEEEELLTFNPNNMNSDVNLLELEAKRQQKLKKRNKGKKIEVFDLSNVESLDKMEAELEGRDDIDNDEIDELEKKLTAALEKEASKSLKTQKSGKLSKTPQKGEKDPDISDDKKDIEVLFNALGDKEKHQIATKMTKKEKKLLEKKGKAKELKSTSNGTGKANMSDVEANDDDDEGISQSTSRKRTMEELEGNWSDEEQIPVKVKKGETKPKDEAVQKIDLQNASIDPKKLFTIEADVIKTRVNPEIVTNEDGDNMMDEDEQQRMTIAQAFADDDIIEEFRMEKNDVADNDKVKDINLVLPGWGEWGGTGINPSKKKKKRFVIKRKAAIRKDSIFKNVILHEKKDEAVAQHQVKQLPNQFLSPQQFEQSISQPIGSTWNPEKAFHRMIKPRVVTQRGSIIKPMDKEDMFKKQKLDKKTGIRTGTHFPHNKKDKKSFENKKTVPRRKKD